MTDVRIEAVTAARDAVPFLVILVVWLAVMLAMYGVFLATKPAIDYAAWIHASIFLPGLVGYLGHTLRQALSVLAG